MVSINDDECVLLQLVVALIWFQISSAHRCAWRPESKVTDSEREIGAGREEVQLTGHAPLVWILENKIFQVMGL